MHKIHLTDDHHIVGEIKEGMVQVHDIVHGGVSELELTGDPPQLEPIPLSDLKARGFDVRIEDIDS